MKAAPRDATDMKIIKMNDHIKLPAINRTKYMKIKLMKITKKQRISKDTFCEYLRGSFDFWLFHLPDDNGEENRSCADHPGVTHVRSDLLEGINVDCRHNLSEVVLVQRNADLVSNC